MVVESWILGGEPNVIGIHISALAIGYDFIFTLC